MYIDKEETYVEGLNTHITSLASQNITDTITITNGRNRELALQLYDTKKKEWETKKTFALNDQEKQELKIDYPDFWKKANTSKWRINIDEGDTVLGYQSKDIQINASNRQNVSLVAKSAIIMDYDTNQIYYQKAINTKRSIASTTKITTCLVALENTKLDDKVRLTSETVTTHLTRLKGVGDQVKMKDLLYAAMVSSDNGAATAIAQHTGGTLTNFAKMMNEKVKEIGCTNTHFTNPQGFTAKNHYSTAKDLALITQAAYSNKQMQSIIKTQSYSFTTLKKHNSYQFKTTNKLLGKINGVTGMKTGTTYAAGKCFVCTYQHNKKTYIIVVLGSSEKGRWEDTKKLINYVNKYC